MSNTRQQRKFIDSLKGNSTHTERDGRTIRVYFSSDADVDAAINGPIIGRANFHELGILSIADGESRNSRGYWVSYLQIDLA